MRPAAFRWFLAHAIRLVNKGWSPLGRSCVSSSSLNLKMLSEVLQRFLIRVLFAVAQVLEQRKHRSLEVRDRHKFPSYGQCRLSTCWPLILLGQMHASNEMFRAEEGPRLSSKHKVDKKRGTRTLFVLR